ncbi:MAG: hypothetical protein ABL995_05230 [Bryobacteraceae bacterium]
MRIILAVSGLLACNSGHIVDAYTAAQCVAFTQHPTENRTREWETKIVLPNGEDVIVNGANRISNVVASYPSTKEKVIVAAPGDYVYPLDVRYDPQNGVLYTLADGLAGGIGRRTELFAFDLVHRHQLGRRRVDRSNLPPICPD